MGGLTRRQLLQAGGLLLTAGTFGLPGTVRAASRKRVVVVGGGIGGATAAKYLRLADASIEVTLIEPNPIYHTCIMSNEVIAGERDLASLAFNYAVLRAHGVNIVQDRVSRINAAHHSLLTEGGKTFEFDRCIVSPGVEFRWDAVHGYSRKLAERIPYAYEAGPQTLLLQHQLKAMRDGGTVIIAPPRNPYRCPIAPYERASLIAAYLKAHKPKSKVLILDPKERFDAQSLFFSRWGEHYGYGGHDSLIEWVSSVNGGAVEALDAKRMTIKTTGGSYKGDMINIIPPQRAGKIASVADLTDASGWCPVDEKTFESTRHQDIHVIGDSSVSTPLPKTGYAANVEAKACAAAVAALLNGNKPPEPAFTSACYAMVAPDDAFSDVEMYRLGADGRIHQVPNAGGLSPIDAPPAERKAEAAYAHSWFNNITKDVFG